MATYVVDASVVIQRVLKEPQTPNAKELFYTVKTLNNELIVPEFCLLECTNVVWKHIRFRELPAEQGEHIAKGLERLPLRIEPLEGILNESLQVGLAHQLAIYDSVYIVMAKQLDVPLITVDGKQAAAATVHGVTLRPLTDFTLSTPE